MTYDHWKTTNPADNELGSTHQQKEDRMAKTPYHRMIAYRVEQGMTSPRDGTIAYRSWEEFYIQNDAITCAKELGFARVVKTEIIAEYQQGKLVKRL